uniref:Uncharacterized protein n=1 Tax=viral metagenome TaxID=1070528 RepID=A0A6M3LBQ6_9ZZZZ
MALKPIKNTNNPKSKAKPLQTKAAIVKAVYNKPNTNVKRVARAVKSMAKSGKKGGFFSRFIGR